MLEANRDITERREFEVALRESQLQSRFRASIVESSDDIIGSKSLDGIITSWNKGAERVLGYSAGEAIGQPITLVIPADRQSEEREILTRIRRGERIDHFETVRLINPTGAALVRSHGAAQRSGLRSCPADFLY